MYNNIFDSHAHYDDEAFDEDRDELLDALPSKGVSCVVNCASDLRTARTSVELSDRYDYIYAAVGVHPHEAAAAAKGDLDEVKKLLTLDKVVAVGEIGLDYHYDFSPRDVQKRWFEEQIRLAKEYDMPVIVHDREAHGDTMELLKKYRPKGVVHCFSGSVEMAREVVSLGMYIGIGGAVTFKNAKMPVKVVADIPIEYILTETDSPYMTPVPYRGKRCDSSYIPLTAERMAEIKGMTAQDVLDTAGENARRLFGI